MNQAGAVVGMVTAGGVANGPTGSVAVSFAVAIDRALTVVHQIESGQASAVVLLGLPGVLGVVIGSSTTTGGRRQRGGRFAGRKCGDRRG